MLSGEEPPRSDGSTESKHPYLRYESSHIKILSHAVEIALGMFRLRSQARSALLIASLNMTGPYSFLLD